MTIESRGTRAGAVPAAHARLARSSARLAFAASIALCSAASVQASPGADLLASAEARNGVATWSGRTFTARIDSYGDGGAVVREREVDVAERNDPDGGQRLAMEFRSPSDVQGTIFLRLRPRSGDLQEWIWSPASRKARRIAPDTADESGSGAELSLRDVEALTRVLQWRDADATFTIAEGEAIDGKPARAIDISPTTGELPHPRYRLWLGADDALPLQLAILDGTGETVKLVRARDFTTVDGHATPREIEVTAPATGRRSVFRLRDVRYREVPDGEFALSRLNRGR